MKIERISGIAGNVYTRKGRCQSTLALSVVMSVNYLAIVLCPFIIDLLRNILHMQGERFPFILSAGLAFVAVLLTWRYRNSYAFGLDKSYYRQ